MILILDNKKAKRIKRNNISKESIIQDSIKEYPELIPISEIKKEKSYLY